MVVVEFIHNLYDFQVYIKYIQSSTINALIPEQHVTIGQTKEGHLV